RFQLVAMCHILRVFPKKSAKRSPAPSTLQALFFTILTKFFERFNEFLGPMDRGGKAQGRHRFARPKAPSTIRFVTSAATTADRRSALLHSSFFIPHHLPRLLKIFRINLKPNKPLRPAIPRRQRRMPNPQKRIHHHQARLGAVQLDALLGEFDWKGCRMRPLLLATANRSIRHEPVVAATPLVMPV